MEKQTLFESVEKKDKMLEPQSASLFGSEKQILKDFAAEMDFQFQPAYLFLES
jgi:hypothetical protein